MFAKKSTQWSRKLTPVQKILIFYLLAVILSTFLLLFPKNYQPNVEVTFIDVLFTAVSALSVTGLSTISIAETFSPIGILVLILILQLGAVGIMATGTFIWLLFGKKIGLTERWLLKTDQNQPNFSGLVMLIKNLFIILLMIQLISFLVLSVYYLKYYPFKEAILHGLFGTVSAITNGGFDITGDSLIGYKHDYFLQSVHIILIIIGAIGFPVLIEVKEFLFLSKEKRSHYRFSLFTKTTTLTFFILIVLGTFFIYIFDRSHFFKHQPGNQIFFYAFFQSVTTRSGGLSTLPIAELSEANQLFMSFLMFIGGSPSSAGGGIRTTTFALVILFLCTYARGGKRMRLFNREIDDKDLLKAITVMIMAILLICVAVLALLMIEPFDLLPILFEVTSAFGTVGLSFGITGDLKLISKLILILLMFIGRVGVLTFLWMFKKERPVGKYRLPKEKIMIG